MSRLERDQAACAPTVRNPRYRCACELDRCMTQSTRLTPQTAGDGGTPGLGSGRQSARRRGGRSGSARCSRCDERSRADYERMERGYYEHLLDAGRRQLGATGEAEADVAAAGRKGWLHLEAPPFEAGPLADSVSDVREFVLKPNLVFDHDGQRAGAPTALGMRDRTYASAKPPGTFRIAFVGDSIGAGWGVNDGEGFEPLLEQSPRRAVPAAGGPAVEVLNFAVPGHGPGQRWDHFAQSRLGPGARPRDLRGDPGRRGLGRAAAPRPAAPRRRLGRATVPRRAGRGRRTPGRISPRLQADAPAVTATLSSPASTAPSSPTAGSRGIPCVLLLVPRVGKAADPAERRHLTTLAASRRASPPVVDLTDALRWTRPGRPGDRPERLPSQRRRPRTPGPTACSPLSTIGPS